MTSFITVDPNGPSGGKALLWEETSGKFKVVSRHESVADIPDANDVDIYSFDVPTTLEIRSPANEGNYPVVDDEGAPLWPGARVAFTIPNYHINRMQGVGEFKRADPYGGVEFVSDKEMPIRDRNGATVAMRREQYTAWDNFHADGPLKGYRMLSGRLGDPHEHGQSSVFMSLVDDPRRVCTPALKPPTP